MKKQRLVWVQVLRCLNKSKRLFLAIQAGAFFGRQVPKFKPGSKSNSFYDFLIIVTRWRN